MQKENIQSDRDLINLSKKDPEVFGLLMERYQDPLFHYIRRLGQYTKEDTEDLLQEVFIKIYQKLNTYSSSIKFSSFVYRVAHNHIIDSFRKMQARPQTSTLEEDEWEKIASSSINMDADIAQKDCVQKIQECIYNLPLLYKNVLILRFLEDKEYDEIMDILKKPKGTVATLIARGKERLRDSMRERGIDCF